MVNLMNSIKFTDGDISRVAYIDNLFIVNLVYALIHISNDINDKNIDGLLDESNINLDKDTKLMLDELLINLEKELKKFMMQDIHRPIATKIRDRLKIDLEPAILFLKTKNISLEILSMYIMYKSFVKADVLHKNFEQFTDGTKYSLIVDTLDVAGFSLREKLNMIKIANEVILRIRRK